MSAPRKFDRDSITSAICARLALGEPMAVICRDIGISRRTVNQWREDDKDIDEKFLDARDDGYDFIAADCLSIADNPMRGEEVITKHDGTVETRSGDMLGHRKLRVETRLKLLAKWDPRRYGEKQQLEHTGPNGGPIQSISTVTDDPVKAAEIYQKVMAGDG